MEQIQQFQLKNNNDSYTIYDHSSNGAFFGNGYELYVRNDFFNNNIYSNFPYTYEDNIEKGKSIFTGDSNNNITNFKIKEIEVFKLHG